MIHIAYIHPWIIVCKKLISTEFENGRTRLQLSIHHDDCDDYKTGRKNTGKIMKMT